MEPPLSWLPDGSAVLVELLTDVEVDVLADCPAHNAGEAGGHPRHGQGQQVVKCGVKHLHTSHCQTGELGILNSSEIYWNN